MLPTLIAFLSLALAAIAAAARWPTEAIQVCGCLAVLITAASLARIVGGRR